VANSAAKSRFDTPRGLTHNGAPRAWAAQGRVGISHVFGFFLLKEWARRVPIDAMTVRFILLAGVVALTAACASNTIVPNYSASNPNMKVGNERPEDTEDTIENAGSFCLQINEKWHKDGKTPDDKALWSKDTFRKVVPCP
jgi:hypothetical protein